VATNDRPVLALWYHKQPPPKVWKAAGPAQLALSIPPRAPDHPVQVTWTINVIDWYKKYRDILNSDIIHLRRADGRDWDGIMHVNPQLKNKALLMLYNPTNERITRIINLPLYYSGLTEHASIREREGNRKKYSLNREYEVPLNVTLEPESYSWWVIE
jgi:hypothetical protein